MTLTHVLHPRATRFPLEAPVRSGGTEVRDAAARRGRRVAAQAGETTFALTIDDEEFGRSERERLTAQPRAGQNDA